MRYCVLSSCIIVAGGVFTGGCAPTWSEPGTQTAATTTQPAGGIPTTSQPAAIPGPSYSPSLLDPLLESTAGARAATTGDVNNDGELDAASISGESQPVQIHLRNPATGVFETISIAGGTPLVRMVDLALADFDADGRQDIVVLVTDSGILPPEGCGVLAALVFLFQGADPRDSNQWMQDYIWFCGETLTDLAVGDFDGQGGPDVVVAANMSVVEPDSDVANTDIVTVIKFGDDDPPDSMVYLFPNPGASNARNASLWGVSVLHGDAPDIERVEAGDLDLDGDLEVVAAYPTAISHNLRWLRNPQIPSGADAARAGNWDEQMVGQQDGGGDAIALGDIDRDGDIDVAASHTLLRLTQWFRNPGPGVLNAQIYSVPWYVFNIGEIVSEDQEIDQVRLVDLDRNGRLDCFVTASGVAWGFEPRLNVEDYWTPFLIFDTDPPAAIGRVGFADFDHDGLLDFIAPLDRDGLTLDQFLLFARDEESQPGQTASD